MLSPFGSKTTKENAAPPPASSSEFEWDQSEKTSTAWSAITAKPRRSRRAFGVRGGGGLRRNNNHNANNPRRKILPSLRSRDALSEESGYLVDDSSPEPSRIPSNRSIFFTEDSSDSFATCETAASTRSGIHMSARPTQSRAAASVSVALPPMPKPVAMQDRSLSFVFGREVGQRESSTSSSNDGYLPDWGENAYPNEQKDPSMQGVSGDMEKLRPARRNSFQGFALPPSMLGDAGDPNEGPRKLRAPRRNSIHGLAPRPADTKGGKARCFSTLARSADMGELAWSNSQLPDHLSPSKTLLDAGESTESGPSPSPSTSSRKRACSPCSDFDDFSCTASMHSSSSFSGRRTRSRSRVFSPVPGQGLPFAPPLTLLGKSEDDRVAMDVDSDDCASESNGDESSEHNSSFHSTSDHESPNVIPQFKARPSVSEDEDIFETMSSYDDLKWLIKDLRRVSAQANANVVFKFNSWSVTPPIEWPPTRRATFYEWATKRLGFTVRALGGGSHLTYLQISKSKGASVKEKLEAALISFKRQQEKGTRGATAGRIAADSHGFPVVNFCGTSPAVSETRQESRNAVHAIPNAVTSSGLEDLTRGMVSLKVQEQVDAQKAPLSRTVTIDPPSIALARSSRSSVERAACSQDDNFFLHRNTPSDVARRKHSKKCLASVSSSAGANLIDRGSVPFPSSVAPIQSLEFFETPSMKQTEEWGSRPVKGRDWGRTCRVEESIIAHLMDQLDDALEAAGKQSCCRRATNFAANIGLEFEDDAVSVTLSKGTKKEDPSANEKKDARQLRRRQTSFAKHRRMSLWTSTSGTGRPVQQQKPLFRAIGPIDENARLSLHPQRFPQREHFLANSKSEDLVDPANSAGSNDKVVGAILSFLPERELLNTASLVSPQWSDAATNAHANLMLASVGCDKNDEDDNEELICASHVALSMGRSWDYLTKLYPWARFLSEGAFKRVYRVYNSAVGKEEAVSVMDVEAIVDKRTVAAELAVSAMLSSLTRRGICPNFVVTRGVFTCPYEPPSSYWGDANNKRPKGDKHTKNKSQRRPREPKNPQPGRFQYIRMELCREGDTEEFMKRQPRQAVCAELARSFVFQIAFALHVSADRFSLKHYDIKLLNVFLQGLDAEEEYVVLRYGLGSHVFGITMPTVEAKIAKLADYGTANVKSESNGQPVTIAQFTTLENTPPDFMILGDEARQGHGHDNFGLGLCMLHLFTGNAPYEEILENVKCPPGLKKRLRKVYEDDSVEGYSVIRSIILADVSKDEMGHIVEGEPDEVLYDTLYRFIVLFGIPQEKFGQKKCPRVWKAITDCLEGGGSVKKGGRPFRKKQGLDYSQYSRDRRKYSIRTGSNQYIARARRQLMSMEGGMDLLCRLCAFDPSKRASAMDVMNSTFMEELREPKEGVDYGFNTKELSFMAFSTQG